MLINFASVQREDKKTVASRLREGCQANSDATVWRVVMTPSIFETKASVIGWSRTDEA